MQLFKLFGSVMVDNKKANDSLQKTDSLASKLSKGLGSGIKTVAKWGAALTTGAIAGGAALFGVTKKAADVGDRVDKLSQKINMSRKGFQEWEYILSQNGTSIEVLQGGMKKMNKTLDDAKMGNDKAVESFKRVGLSIDDIKNSTPEQAFEMTVEALQKMPDGAEKAALANELLGRSGSELMPLLNGSSDSVKELKKQAHDLGIVLSDDAVDASAKFTDTLDNLQRSFGAVVSKVGVAVMPLMQQFADWILANMPTIQAVFGAVFGFIQRVVQTAVDVFNKYLLPVFQAIFDWVQKNWPTIKQIISDAIDGAKLAFDKLIEVGGKVIEAMQPVFNFFKDVVIYIANFKDETNLTVPILGGLVAGLVAFKGAMAISGLISTVSNGIKAFTIATKGQTIAQGLLNAVMAVNPFVLIAIAIGVLVAAGIALWKNWDTVVAKAKELMAKLSEVWDGIKAKVVEVWDSIKAKISEVWNGIKAVITSVVTAIKTVIATYFNIYKTIITTVFNAIKSTTSNVWNGIKTTVSNVVNGVKSTVTNVFTGLKNTVTNIWNGIKTAIMTPINGAVNIVKGAIDRIKGLFSFEFKWPKLKMPSFSIKGSMNPLKWIKEGVPKLSVNWNAKGAIFDKPTIFETARGYQGVGEAGPEAVTPISKLQEMIDWNKTDNSGLERRMDMMIELLSLLLGKDMSVYLDSKKISKAVSPHMNKDLARLREREVF